jgi:hypothetical protein
LLGKALYSDLRRPRPAHSSASFTKRLASAVAPPLGSRNGRSHHVALRRLRPAAAGESSKPAKPKRGNFGGLSGIALALHDFVSPCVAVSRGVVGKDLGRRLMRRHVCLFERHPLAGMMVQEPAAAIRVAFAFRDVQPAIWRAMDALNDEAKFDGGFDERLA